MAISTLNEYYQSKGQALPSVAERQGIAAQAGIQNYTGTAQQNTQLLSSLMGNQGNQTATPTPTIPGTVATGTTTPMDLPNRPTPQEPGNVYSNASAYISSLPKTGVAGLDQTLQAMAERPGQLAQQYDIANKQSLMNEAKNKLDAFNEQYRVQQERIRTEGGKTLEQINSEVNAIERTRAFTAGTLAIEAAYRTGDYQGARELMNQQAQLELEPLKMKYDFFKDLYNRTEDQKFQRAMKSADQSFQREMKLLDTANNLKTEALKQGVPFDILNKAKTPDEVAKAMIDYKKSLVPTGFENVKPENVQITKLLVEYNNFIKDKGFFELNKPENVALKANLVSEISAEYKDAKKLGTLDAGVEKVVNGLIGNTGIARYSPSAQSLAINQQLNRMGYDTTQADTSGVNLFNNIKKQVSSIYDPNKGFMIPGKTQ